MPLIREALSSLRSPMATIGLGNSSSDEASPAASGEEMDSDAKVFDDSDSDHDDYANLESWPWKLHEFNSLEEEIHFYRMKLETYENDKTKTLVVLSLQLLLGTAYAAAGELAVAEEILQDIRTRTLDAWGWNHVATIACAKSLTKVLERLQKYDEAQALYEAAVAGVRWSMGREYPWTLELSTNWACFCARRSYFGQARNLLTDSYNAKRHVLGYRHRATLDTLCNLGRLPIDEPNGYEGRMEIAFQSLRKHYGDKNPSTIRALKHLVSLHRIAGECEEARKLCDEFHIPVPEDGNLCEWHEDNLLIPSLKTERRIQDGGNLPVDRIKYIIRKVGPKWGKRSFRTLEGVRSLISKWTGMDVKTFTEYLGIESKLAELCSLINPAVLLEEACAAGHEPAVRMLLEKYSKHHDWNEGMKLAIQKSFRRAVLSGSESVVRVLLDSDIDINSSDEVARTALHDAAEMGHDGVAGLLLDIGADTQTMDGNGNIPMDMAMIAGHEAVVRLFMGHNGAILTSSTTAAIPTTSTKRSRLIWPRVTGFDATIVHFYVEGSAGDADFHDHSPNDAHRVQTVPVERLVWNSDGLLDEVLAGQSKGDLYPEATFRWIHLPANCMEWVEALMISLRAGSTDDRPCPDLLRDELWTRQLHNPIHSSVHGRCMKPLCREVCESPGDSGSLVAFMPYLHWESETKRRDMNKEIAGAVADFDVSRLTHAFIKTVDKAFTEESQTLSNPDKDLLAAHLFPLPPQPPLHLRRTLDQFQYYMTDNTEDRDTDQVISRYFKRRHPEIPLPVMMVDQLWIWIVNPTTLVTSFPQRWGSKKGQPRDNDILDMRNVIASILSHIKQKERSPIACVFDLAELIMTHCLGLNTDKMEWKYETHRYLEIFDYSINYVANEEIRCFNTFADRAREKDKKRADASREKSKNEVSDIKAKRMKVQRAKTPQEDNHRSAGNIPGQDDLVEIARPMAEGPNALGNRNEDRSMWSGTMEEEFANRISVEGVSERNSWHSRESEEERKRRIATGRRVFRKADDIFNKLAEVLSDAPAVEEVHPKEDSFDISHEVELLREIKDIRDELNILSNLFGQQKLVLEPFTRIINQGRDISARKTGSYSRDSGSKPSLLAAVDRHITYIKRMDANARRVYRHLEDLLDLKQKQANVFEARTARVSGNTITVFTVVTIIFLPASFMAAFLALPIAKYPSVDGDKMELSYATKHTVIVSITVAVPFIVFALCVNHIMRFFKAVSQPFQTVVRYCHKIAPYLGLVMKGVYQVFRFVIRYCRGLLRLLGKLFVSCFWLLIRITFNWRRIYASHKRLRAARKKAKKEGKEWKYRHYFTLKVLKNLFKVLRDPPKSLDLEEQHGDDTDMEMVMFSSCSRLEEASEIPRSNESQESRSQRPKSERAVSQRPVMDDGEGVARRQTW